LLAIWIGLVRWLINYSRQRNQSNNRNSQSNIRSFQVQIGTSGRSMINTGKIIWVVGVYRNCRIHHLQGLLLTTTSKWYKMKCQYANTNASFRVEGFNLLVVTQSNLNRTSAQKYRNDYLQSKSISTTILGWKSYKQTLIGDMLQFRCVYTRSVQGKDSCFVWKG
jgi:hypothetical protein